MRVVCTRKCGCRAVNTSLRTLAPWIARVFIIVKTILYSVSFGTRFPLNCPLTFCRATGLFDLDVLMHPRSSSCSCIYLAFHPISIVMLNLCNNLADTKFVPASGLLWMLATAVCQQLYFVDTKSWFRGLNQLESAFWWHWQGLKLYVPSSMLIDVLIANSWKEKAVWLREKVGLCFAARR